MIQTISHLKITGQNFVLRPQEHAVSINKFSAKFLIQVSCCDIQTFYRYISPGSAITGNHDKQIICFFKRRKTFQCIDVDEVELTPEQISEHNTLVERTGKIANQIPHPAEQVDVNIASTGGVAGSSRKIG